MNSSDKWWLSFTGMVLATLVTIIVTANVYYAHKNKIKLSLIQAGVKPIEIGCMLDDEYNREVKCIVLATKIKD